MKNVLWTLFGFFSIVIGLYPILYFVIDMVGFLDGKSEELRSSTIWNWFFYQHIIFGAVSMLTGWTQFSSRLRKKYMSTHRLLGKVYVVAVMLSGLAGFYLSLYATGGIIASLGFGTMAVFWLGTTVMAFFSIKKGQIQEHQNWMIRSYALCWAAVTLRLWLPSLQAFAGMEFLSAYLLVSWLCWVPNLVVAELIVRRT